MSIQNEYLNGLMERVIRRDPGEKEFHQAVREVLTSLAPVANARPELIKEGMSSFLSSLCMNRVRKYGWIAPMAVSEAAATPGVLVNVSVAMPSMKLHSRIPHLG